MLQELVKYLVDTGKSIGEFKVIDHPNDPDRRLIIGNDGVKALETPRQPPKKKDVFFTVEDFAAHLAHDATLAGLDAVVWYDENKAVTYSNDQFRIASATINFPHHPVLESIKKLAGEAWFEQKALIRYLRVGLGGFVDEFVLNRFRQLSWDSARRVRQSMAHGNASMDSEVSAKVTTADAEVPEQFSVTIPLFANREWSELKTTVRVIVDIDVDQCRIGLSLYPGTLDVIQSEQRTAIYGLLSNEITDGYQMLCGTSQIEAK